MGRGAKVLFIDYLFSGYFDPPPSPVANARAWAVILAPSPDT